MFATDVPLPVKHRKKLLDCPFRSIWYQINIYVFVNNNNNHKNSYLIHYQIMFKLLFWQERQPVSNLFHIQTDLPHSSVWTGILRAFLTDHVTVYQNWPCSQATVMHDGKENMASQRSRWAKLCMPFVTIIWQKSIRFVIFMPWNDWITVRPT